MKAYLSNLNERERWMVILGGVALCFFLFYWLVYAPLVTSITEKSLQIKDKQETLDWMQTVRSQHATTEKPQSLSNSQLLTLLASQLRATSFKGFTYQIQQMGSGDIQLSYEQVPFNVFITWLWELNKTYTIHMKQFNAEHTSTPGLAKVLVVLSAEETPSSS